jgi:potassium voltage-gated channel Eag-related subfamily H protein 6/hyperpolarization activated cyclic nucleotide-gated potassium channel 2
VEICLTYKEIQLKVLRKGDHFGEISFFSKSPRTASARTLDFVNLKSLSRKDLWECANDLDADLEKLFYIKDCVEMGNSFKPLKIRCYICDRPHHIARNCTILHFRVRRLKIIENYLKEKNERCKNFIRRSGKSFIMTSS